AWDISTLPSARRGDDGDGRWPEPEHAGATNSTAAPRMPVEWPLDGHHPHAEGTGRARQGDGERHHAVPRRAEADARRPARAAHRPRQRRHTGTFAASSARTAGFRTR